LKVEDLTAVIESAKSRGQEPLERFARRRLPEASEDEIEETVEVAVEVIESIPVLIAAAQKTAHERGLSMVVEPLLDRAAHYFMHPMDLIPEMTRGLAGLLDDSYLVLRILSNLERGPDPLVDWELDHPIAFLRRLIGHDIAQKLDDMSLAAFREVSGDVKGYWSEVSHEA